MLFSPLSHCSLPLTPTHTPHSLFPFSLLTPPSLFLQTYTPPFFSLLTHTLPPPLSHSHSFPFSLNFSLSPNSQSSLSPNYTPLSLALISHYYSLLPLFSNSHSSFPSPYPLTLHFPFSFLATLTLLPLSFR